jgi:23S rRNA (adenine2030-N6)-methyltransferase
MNYRHVFHAGNHADVFKHAALTLVLAHLAAKPQPFAVLDTHAGVGAYDLASEGAQATKEYAAGAGVVFGRPLAAAPAYAELLAAMNPDGRLAAYPGSPEIARRLLRAHDRLVLCELHPDDAAALKARYRGDALVHVHRRDGYEAAAALAPPPERRGLVLIDPPYEAPDETARLTAALTAGLRKWPTGIFCAWYPVKDHRIGDALAAAARTGWPKPLRAEFLAYPIDGEAMAGGGLLILNAPWQLDEKLEALCRELHPILGEGHGSWRVQIL